MKILDETGGVAVTHEYNAWGKILDETGSVDVAHRRIVMNDNYIKYKPNQIYIFFIPLLVLGDAIFIMVAGMALQIKDYSLFAFTSVFAIVAGVLIKLCYDLSHTMVFFEVNGLRILNDKGVNHCFIPWENFQYGYYCSNYKGQLHLLLSKNVLEVNKVKILVNKSVNSGKMQVDNVVVIGLLHGQKEKQLYIKEYILRMIPNIREL